jgi:hypothetical protein
MKSILRRGGLPFASPSPSLVRAVEDGTEQGWYGRLHGAGGQARAFDQRLELGARDLRMAHA